MTGLLTAVTGLCASFGAGLDAQNLIGEVLCGAQDEIHAKLTRQFGVVKTGAGLRGPEAIMEIWTNPTTGDWTLVQSYAEGRACILAMGEAWEMSGSETGETGPAPSLQSPKG
ncbi:hypothetical protein [Celeribacter ethanolicus]|uniref:Uncharacterized protein n=1 Tax=Celeribacter ethanolicus TaxID=1758178 RepID=A0A291GBH4_9RHOB|nr:hypothetical protein [Celeribacter ethanolicus]ATG47541.1 hypothetical protein CEW89_08115 [Celeribacter ethanolicus]TNE65472.1 MAG: hypothetical protein EP336_12480 [Paracoccaceae bacterium]